ncbi:hypothetical protein K456DRAFT_32419 [Colletotrichum gloeosporioides 23]|nr:hypothetical protein K456DRAFT_32419 [Colletotrichum gloeosporioides 23]
MRLIEIFGTPSAFVAEFTQMRIPELLASSNMVTVKHGPGLIWSKKMVSRFSHRHFASTCPACSSKRTPLDMAFSKPLQICHWNFPILPVMYSLRLPELFRPEKVSRDKRKYSSEPNANPAVLVPEQAWATVPVETSGRILAYLARTATVAHCRWPSLHSRNATTHVHPMRRDSSATSTAATKHRATLARTCTMAQPESSTGLEGKGSLKQHDAQLRGAEDKFPAKAVLGKVLCRQMERSRHVGVPELGNDALLVTGGRCRLVSSGDGSAIGMDGLYMGGSPSGRMPTHCAAKTSLKPDEEDQQPEEVQEYKEAVDERGNWDSKTISRPFALDVVRRDSHQF